MGTEAGRCALKTAGPSTQFLVEVDTGRKDRCEVGEAAVNFLMLPADGENLAYVKIRLADADGNWNRQEKKAVTIKAEGNALLQGYGSANPSCLGSYNAINVSRLDGLEDCVQESTWETYDGVAMAVIRAGKVPGKTKIIISSNGCTEESFMLVCGKKMYNV